MVGELSMGERNKLEPVNPIGTLRDAFYGPKAAFMPKYTVVFDLFVTSYHCTHAEGNINYFPMLLSVQK